MKSYSWQGGVTVTGVGCIIFSVILLFSYSYSDDDRIIGQGWSHFSYYAADSAKSLHKYMSHDPAQPLGTLQERIDGLQRSCD